MTHLPRNSRGRYFRTHTLLDVSVAFQPWLATPFLICGLFSGFLGQLFLLSKPFSFLNSNLEDWLSSDLLSWPSFESLYDLIHSHVLNSHLHAMPMPSKSVSPSWTLIKCSKSTDSNKYSVSPLEAFQNPHNQPAQNWTHLPGHSFQPSSFQ